MTSAVYFITAIALGFSAYFISRFVRARLIGQSRRVFEVSFNGEKKERVAILTSASESLALRVQEVLDQAVKLVRTKDHSPNLHQFAAELEAARRDRPLSCEIHFALARVYRRMNDLPRAIGVWSDYIQNKERAGERDAELAGAYYNRSCYEALLRRDTSVCLKDLEQAIAISDKYRQTSLSDPDLLAVRDHLPG